MVKYISGNALEVQTDYLAHQVNDHGVMGAGIAKQIKEKYPEVFELYKKRCKADHDLIGTFFPVHVEGKTIVNCFSQRGISRTKKTTDYDAIRKIFSDLEWMCFPGKVITVPYGYGCGLAGGSWEKVSKIFEDIFIESDVILQIVKMKDRV